MQAACQGGRPAANVDGQGAEPECAEEAAQAKVNGMFNRLQAHSRRPAQRCHVTRNQNSFAGKYIPGSSRYQSVEEEPSPGLQNESGGQES